MHVSVDRILEVCENEGILCDTIVDLKKNTNYDCAWFLVDDRTPPEIETSVCPYGENIISTREKRYSPGWMRSLGLAD